MRDAPFLSLILPAHNAARYIEPNVHEVIRALAPLDRPFEVLVVSDGSTDGTPAVVSQIRDDRVRSLGYADNRGKGYAICFGVAHARGRLVGWLDADLDIDPTFIAGAARAFEDRPIDAVIGSKRHPTSRVDYPRIRRVLSSVFQLLVRCLFRIAVRDTQVGAKLFRGEMLRTVVPLLLVKQYAFDLEVLAVGAEFGFDRIEEAPVTLDYRFTGSGITRQAVWRMFIDTLAIAYRIHIRHWYVRQFAALERRRSDAEADAETQLLAPSKGTLSEIFSVRG